MDTVLGCWLLHAGQILQRWRRGEEVREHEYAAG
jgi:hypothetical protein